MCLLIEEMRRQWCELDRRITELDKELAEWVRNEETARRLMTIPGIGVSNSTALIAAIGRAYSRRQTSEPRLSVQITPLAA
jgi:transposase